MSIKLMKLILTVALALFTRGARSEHFSDQPLSLTIDSITKVITSGSEVKISTNLTNTSDKPVVVEDNGIFWYLVEVSRPDGRQVKQTEKGKELRKGRF